MFYYILLFLVLFLIENVQTSNKQKLSLAFVWLSLFSGLRYGIGFDYFMYSSFVEKDFMDRELIPSVFTFLANRSFTQLFFILTSIFTHYFIFKGLKRLNVPFLVVYFYVSFPFFYVASWSVVRQCMAYAVIFYIMCCFNDSLKKKIALFVIAFLCHRSSLIAAGVLLPFHKFSNKTFWICFLSALMMGEILVRIVMNMSSEFSLLLQFQGFIEEGYEGGGMKKYLVYVLAMSLLLLRNRVCKRIPVNNQYYTWMVIGVSLYAIMSASGHIAERFCSFYFFSVLLLIPMALKIVRLPYVFYKAFCVLLFTFNVYTCHVASMDSVDIKTGLKSYYYPYRTVLF